MSEYTYCWLDQFQIKVSEDEIDSDMISLFQKSEKVISTYQSKLVPQSIQRFYSKRKRDEDIDLPFVCYTAPIDVIKDRLEIMGYTLSTSREVFECYMKYYRDSSNDQTYPSRERALFTNLNVDSWLEKLQLSRKKKNSSTDPLIDFMISEIWYGFPGVDSRIPLRLILEICQNSKELIYDLTDLIWSEYYDPEDDFIKFSLEIPTHYYGFRGKIIILTEGSTDAWILKESLRLLFPHLADYYSFMDFEDTRVEGGAPNLSKLVKAFAGAGVMNRAIAIFDNDTAGTAEVENLKKLKWPSHIKVLKLPDLDQLRNYLTLGPSGNQIMDVNGLAASLELYLGADVLVDDENQLFPVQWTGYNSAIRKYQGEVIHKRKIQDNFREKLKNAKANQDLLVTSHWDGLKSIFKMIFSAFQDLNSSVVF